MPKSTFTGNPNRNKNAYFPQYSENEHRPSNPNHTRHWYERVFDRDQVDGRGELTAKCLQCVDCGETKFVKVQEGAK